MILRNVKFDFKVTKGKDYKRYIQGYKAAMAALNVLDKEDDCLLYTSPSPRDTR